MMTAYNECVYVCVLAGKEFTFVEFSAEKER